MTNKDRSYADAFRTSKEHTMPLESISTSSKSKQANKDSDPDVIMEIVEGYCPNFEAEKAQDSSHMGSKVQKCTQSSSASSEPPTLLKETCQGSQKAPEAAKPLEAACENGGRSTLRLAEMERQLESMNMEIARLERSGEMLRKVNKGLSNEVVQRDRDLKSCRANLTQLENAHDQTHASLFDREKECEKLRNQLNQVTTQNASLKEKVRGLAKLLTCANKSLNGSLFQGLIEDEGVLKEGLQACSQRIGQAKRNAQSIDRQTEERQSILPFAEASSPDLSQVMQDQVSNTPAARSVAVPVIDLSDIESHRGRSPSSSSHSSIVISASSRLAQSIRQNRVFRSAVGKVYGQDVKSKKKIGSRRPKKIDTDLDYRPSPWPREATFDSFKSTARTRKQIRRDVGK